MRIFSSGRTQVRSEVAQSPAWTDTLFSSAIRLPRSKPGPAWIWTQRLCEHYGGTLYASRSTAGSSCLWPDNDLCGEQVSEQERMDWVHLMRGKFSPAGMINEDLSIRQDFFKPEKVISSAWTDRLKYRLDSKWAHGDECRYSWWMRKNGAWKSVTSSTW